MKNFLAGTLIPGIVAVVGIMLLVVWTAAVPSQPIKDRLPGMDNAPEPVDGASLATPVPGEPVRSERQPSELAGEWPWFRGPNLNAICDDGVPLVRPRPGWKPTELWSVELGQGYAAAAVRDGCVYVLDYDELARADTMRCLSLDDGQEIWHNSYPVAVVWNHGMSRTVAAVAGEAGEHVVSFGPKCHVTCWDARTGKAHWLLDLVRDYGATVPQWYAGQCPLIDNDRLILAPGGEALLMAVDYRSGDVIWKSANPHGWVMTHASIVPMDVSGRRTYVYCGNGGVAGVSADDGKILWDTTDWRIDMATCPSPVIVTEGRIFCSGGYNSGAMMLRVGGDGDALSIETLFRLKPKQFSSEQQTPVFFEGHLFGVRQKDKQLVCLDLDGNEVWNSGKDKFGAGPYMIADGMIFVMDDDGVLSVAEANAAHYRRLARAEVIAEGHTSWGPMAMVAGRLIVRDMTRMVCLYVGEE